MTRKLAVLLLLVVGIVGWVHSADARQPLQDPGTEQAPPIYVGSASPTEASRVLRDEPQPWSCRPTASHDLLPQIVAPLQGQYPVWLVTTDDPEWTASTPLKILWVVAKDRSGPLVVTGRHPETGDRAYFTGGGRRTPSLRLEVAEANTGGVFPGGAGPEIVGSRAFHPSYGYLPRTGCWELTAAFGGELHQIVITVG